MKKLIIMCVVITATSAIEVQKEDVKKNDRQAVEFYRYALKVSNDQSFSVCDLAGAYADIEYVENYSQKRARVLGKMGITPVSAKALKLLLARQIAQVLKINLEPNKSLGVCMTGMCTHYIGGGIICGRWHLSLVETQEIVGYLERLLKDNPDLDK